MKTKLLVAALAAVYSTAAMADVVMLATDAVKEGHQIKLGDKAQRDAQKAGGGTRPNTGERALTDSSGFEYFINTDITFATSSSASGAASEASYTAPVNATTSAGGVVATTLNDAFDGYGALCVSLDGGTGPCVAQTRGFSYVMYNRNGPATVDPNCAGGRQIVLPVQTEGNLQIQRKVYVPGDDAFARWLNVFTNTGSSPITFNAIASNNMGSDSNTTISATSSGDTTATIADLWVASFQNFSGTTSSDPRLAHVFGGPGAPVSVSTLNFVNGDDNPYWAYPLTLAPGETRIIASFVTGQPSRAAAAAKATQLVNFGSTQSACMTPAEVTQVANFAAGPAPLPVAVPVSDSRVLMALAALTLVLGGLALRRYS